MSWFANLFSSSSSSNSRNSRKAMSSTHEAFSLPTSSPSFQSHPDAFNVDALSTPTSANSSYSYPPHSSGGIYDVVANTSRSRQSSSILPLHSAPLPPLPPYPPLSETWNRLRTWLSREYPELGDTLNYGILPQDLAQIEMSFGFSLPPTVRESYLCVDGQEAESAAGCSEGLFFGLTLLPLEDVLDEWRFWREVDEDPATGANEELRQIMQSIPPGWVRKEYSSRGWIPLVADKAGNYLGVDMHPGDGGAVGQVIVFGRDFDTKVVMWRGDGTGGWAKWLASFVEELESGEGFELGSSNDDSEGSEDSVGYESYFFDGVGGGQGDGGGDTGTGGLRLTGEYKGWSVLEAWADRSVRRWQDAGLVSSDPPSLLSEKGKVGPDKLPLDRLHIAASGGGSAAEVPIPVLSAPEGESSALATTPLGNVTNQNHYAPRQPLPTISVTKPSAPSPQPVDLPTPTLIDELSSSSSTSDLEAGGSMIMQENDDTPQTESGSRPQASRQSTATTIVPSTLPSRTLTDSPEPLDMSHSAAADPTVDLLADSAPPMQGAFDGPLNMTPDASFDHSVKSEDSPVLVNAEDARSQSSDGSKGGVPGIDELSQIDVVLVDESDAAELASINSNDSASASGGKHEKRKSQSSSFKEVGQRGGKRKDSVSSAKGSG